MLSACVRRLLLASCLRRASATRDAVRDDDVRGHGAAATHRVHSNSSNVTATDAVLRAVAQAPTMARRPTTPPPQQAQEQHHTSTVVPAASHQHHGKSSLGNDVDGDAAARDVRALEDNRRALAFAGETTPSAARSHAAAERQERRRSRFTVVDVEFDVGMTERLMPQISRLLALHELHFGDAVVREVDSYTYFARTASSSSSSTTTTAAKAAGDEQATTTTTTTTSATAEAVDVGSALDDAAFASFDAEAHGKHDDVSNTKGSSSSRSSNAAAAVDDDKAVTATAVTEVSECGVTVQEAPQPRLQLQSAATPAPPTLAALHYGCDARPWFVPHDDGVVRATPLPPHDCLRLLRFVLHLRGQTVRDIAPPLQRKVTATEQLLAQQASRNSNTTKNDSNDDKSSSSSTSNAVVSALLLLTLRDVMTYLDTAPAPVLAYTANLHPRTRVRSPAFVCTLSVENVAMVNALAHLAALFAVPVNTFRTHTAVSKMSCATVLCVVRGNRVLREHLLLVNTMRHPGFVLRISDIREVVCSNSSNSSNSNSNSSGNDKGTGDVADVHEDSEAVVQDDDDVVDVDERSLVDGDDVLLHNDATTTTTIADDDDNKQTTTATAAAAAAATAMTRTALVTAPPSPHVATTATTVTSVERMVGELALWKPLYEVEVLLRRVRCTHLDALTRRLRAVHALGAIQYCSNRELSLARAATDVLHGYYQSAVVNALYRRHAAASMRRFRRRPCVASAVRARRDCHDAAVRQLLRVYVRANGDWQKTLHATPYALRRRWVNALRALVWNTMAARRVRATNTRVLVGDLVVRPELRARARREQWLTLKADHLVLVANEAQAEACELQDVYLPFLRGRYPAHLFADVVGATAHPVLSRRALYTLLADMHATQLLTGLDTTAQQLLDAQSESATMLFRRLLVRPVAMTWRVLADRAPVQRLCFDASRLLRPDRWGNMYKDDNNSNDSSSSSPSPLSASCALVPQSCVVEATSLSDAVPRGVLPREYFDIARNDERDELGDDDDDHSTTARNNNKTAAASSYVTAGHAQHGLAGGLVPAQPHTPADERGDRVYTVYLRAVVHNGVAGLTQLLREYFTLHGVLDEAAVTLQNKVHSVRCQLDPDTRWLQAEPYCEVCYNRDHATRSACAEYALKQAIHTTHVARDTAAAAAAAAAATSPSTVLRNAITATTPSSSPSPLAGVYKSARLVMEWQLQRHDTHTAWSMMTDAHNRLVGLKTPRQLLSCAVWVEYTYANNNNSNDSSSSSSSDGVTRSAVVSTPYVPAPLLRAIRAARQSEPPLPPPPPPSSPRCTASATTTATTQQMQSPPQQQPQQQYKPCDTPIACLPYLGLLLHRLYDTMKGSAGEAVQLHGHEHGKATTMLPAGAQVLLALRRTSDVEKCVMAPLPQPPRARASSHKQQQQQHAHTASSSTHADDDDDGSGGGDGGVMSTALSLLWCGGWQLTAIDNVAVCDVLEQTMAKEKLRSKLSAHFRFEAALPALSSPQQQQQQQLTDATAAADAVDDDDQDARFVLEQCRVMQQQCAPLVRQWLRSLPERVRLVMQCDVPAAVTLVRDKDDKDKSNTQQQQQQQQQQSVRWGLTVDPVDMTLTNFATLLDMYVQSRERRSSSTAARAAAATAQPARPRVVQMVPPHAFDALYYDSLSQQQQQQQEQHDSSDNSSSVAQTSCVHMSHVLPCLEAVLNEVYGVVNVNGVDVGTMDAMQQAVRQHTHVVLARPARSAAAAAATQQQSSRYMMVLLQRMPLYDKLLTALDAQSSAASSSADGASEQHDAQRVADTTMTTTTATTLGTTRTTQQQQQLHAQDTAGTAAHDAPPLSPVFVCCTTTTCELDARQRASRLAYIAIRRRTPADTAATTTATATQQQQQQQQRQQQPSWGVRVLQRSRVLRSLDMQQVRNFVVTCATTRARQRITRFLQRPQQQQQQQQQLQQQTQTQQDGRRAAPVWPMLAHHAMYVIVGVDGCATASLRALGAELHRRATLPQQQQQQPSQHGSSNSSSSAAVVATLHVMQYQLAQVVLTVRRSGVLGEASPLAPVGVTFDEQLYVKAIAAASPLSRAVDEAAGEYCTLRRLVAPSPATAAASVTTPVVDAVVRHDGVLAVPQLQHAFDAYVRALQAALPPPPSAAIASAHAGQQQHGTLSRQYDIDDDEEDEKNKAAARSAAATTMSSKAAAAADDAMARQQLDEALQQLHECAHDAVAQLDRCRCVDGVQLLQALYLVEYCHTRKQQQAQSASTTTTAAAVAQQVYKELAQLQRDLHSSYTCMRWRIVEDCTHGTTPETIRDMQAIFAAGVAEAHVRLQQFILS